MKKNLNAYLDLKSLQEQAEFVGFYPMAPVAKLSGKLEQNDNQISVKLRVYQNEQGLNVIDLQWDAKVTTICERCLNPMDLELTAHNQLAICRDNKQASLLPDNLEPVLLEEDEKLSLERLLVEEILLALPLIPRHEEVSCMTGVVKETKQTDEETHKPIAHLDLNVMQ